MNCVRCGGVILADEGYEYETLTPKENGERSVRHRHSRDCDDFASEKASIAQWERREKTAKALRDAVNSLVYSHGGEHYDEVGRKMVAYVAFTADSVGRMMKALSDAKQANLEEAKQP